MMKVMPYGMVAILMGIVVVVILCAKIYPTGGDIGSGASPGALLGIFTVCIFVIHNYVNPNIGVKLTVYQGIAYFIQWVIVGSAIGRPVDTVPHGNYVDAGLQLLAWKDTGTGRSVCREFDWQYPPRPSRDRG